MTPQEVHDQDKRNLEKADIVIAEVTNPSIGIGIEIGYAISMHKSIYAIYQKDREGFISMMVRGNDRVELFAYTDETELDNVLGEILGRYS